MFETLLLIRKARRSPRPRLLAPVMIAALVLAGCNDDAGTTTTSTAVTVADATTSTTASSTTVAAASSSSSVSVPASADVSHLTAVRAAAQGDGDRVTFEFDGAAVPGYSIAYADAGVKTGEGSATVAVQGTKQVEVTFATAASVDLTGGLHQTYTGPKRITPSDTSAVAELTQGSDFEGVLTWVVGTRSQVSFTVSTLTNPPRVVLDFGR